MASDYAIAPDRDAGFGPKTIQTQVPMQEPANPASQSPKRDIFAGLRLKATPIILQPERSPLDKAVERYARAAADIIRMQGKGFEPLEHQRRAFIDAKDQVNALQPEGARDLRTVLNATPGLIDEAAKGRTAAAIRAMAMEAEIRIAATQRADRFVAEWQRQARQFRALDRAGDENAASRVREGMGAMAKSLHRDPQLESLLRNRRQVLGIKPSGRASLSHDLQSWLGPSRSRGIGR